MAKLKKDKLSQFKPKPVLKTQRQKKSFFDSMELYFNSKSKVFLWVSLMLSLVISLMLFNIRISDGGDDSYYILRAYQFLNKSMFPTFQGPIYPLFLSIFVWIFGINVTILKFLSLAFILAQLFLLYKAFKNRLSSFISILSLLIIAINAYVLYYSSQTYNEAFFMMLQALFFLIFFKLVIDKDAEKDAFIALYNDISNKAGFAKAIKSLFKSSIPFIFVGFMIFLLGNTKSIAYSILPAVVLYLFINRKWSGIIFTTAYFLIIYYLFDITKKSLFDIHPAIFNEQLQMLLRVNPYNAAEGLEDFNGYVNRFLTNSNLYLSKHLYSFIGFKIDITKTSTFLTVFTYILFFTSLITAFVKKNKYLIFTGIYLMMVCAAIFFSLQTRWDQGRLILPLFPLILVFILSGFYNLGSIKNLGFFKYIAFILIILITLTNFGLTVKKVKENYPLLTNSLKGNRFYSITPDWVNYIKMSEYAAENVPDSLNIACRKPSISFIYGKREYYGIIEVPTENADSLLDLLKVGNVHYAILANLRAYPPKKTERTVNAVERYFYFINQKYPEKLKLLHTIGTDEQAQLIQILY